MAESLIVALYRSEDRSLVRHLMPPNDYEAQRQPLYRRIFAKFDKLDGREHSSAILPPPRNASTKRHEEVRFFNTCQVVSTMYFYNLRSFSFHDKL